MDEASTADYFTIDGANNVISSLDEEGSVLPSTKAINLILTNLDITFDYYQIAALASISGTGYVSAAYIFPEVGISDTTDNFQISTLSPDIGTIKTTVDEITSTVVIPEIVGTHAQLDNSLYIADLTFASHD